MKRLFLFFFSVSIAACLFAQEPAPKDNGTTNSQEKAESTTKTATEIIKEDNKEVTIDNHLPTKKNSSFGFYTGLDIILSKTERENDPYLGIALNFGVEYEYKPIKYFSFIPSLDLSFFHYGFLITSPIGDENLTGRAYICEIESRTAFTFSFLLDLPVMARFDINSWVLSFGGGLAFFMRAALLEPALKADDLNDYGVTAKKEVQNINKYFWQNGRFLYPSVGFKAEHIFKSRWKVGIRAKSFIPIFNLWQKEKRAFTDSLLFQASIVLYPPAL